MLAKIAQVEEDLYRKIMVPVDLAHSDQLGKALNTAADLGKHFGIPVCYVGITASAPGPLAHTPQEYAARLDAFARAEAERHGHRAEARPVISHDPTADLDDALLRAVKDTGADLVVMASHIPHLSDRIWPSNGGKIASHSDASVFVVRDA